MSEQAVLDHLTLADGELFHDRKGRTCPLPRPLAPLADSHGHLTGLKGHDPALALARAALAGVRLLVVPVDPVDEFPRKWDGAAAFWAWLDEQVQVARECLAECASLGFEPPAFPGSGAPDLLDNVRVVVGAHPYGAASYGDAAEDLARELLEDPRSVGVGEIGLDYGPYSEVPMEVQDRAFRRQLRLAHELRLPVELHIRDSARDPEAGAHDDALRVLREEGVPEAGCDLHCFTSDVRVMEDFSGAGCHVAFGGALTFSRSDAIREAAAFCPERHLLVETDSPYMAPVPLRGEECEPAMVAFTAARLAEVREGEGTGGRQATYDALWRNARKLFGGGA